MKNKLVIEGIKESEHYSFTSGTVFKFKKDAVKYFWFAGSDYLDMVLSGKLFIITKAWQDEEMGDPRFEFVEFGIIDTNKVWLIGGMLSLAGEIVDLTSEK